MSKPVKTALCPATFRAEMKAIETAWEALRALDTDARYRALEWLRTWASDERPIASDPDF